MKNKKKGFTLIELVIVIAIILILVAVAIPKFSKSNLSAQAAAHNLNVKEIKNAALIYVMENPESSNNLGEKELGEYFEGDFPTPAKALGGSKSFSITISNSGEVEVSPGEVKVEGNKLVEK